MLDDCGFGGLNGTRFPALVFGPFALMSSEFDQADLAGSAFSFLPRFNLL
jgi:hypothetical protein